MRTRQDLIAIDLYLIDIKANGITVSLVTVLFEGHRMGKATVACEDTNEAALFQDPTSIDG